MPLLLLPVISPLLPRRTYHPSLGAQGLLTLYHPPYGEWLGNHPEGAAGAAIHSLALHKDPHLSGASVILWAHTFFRFPQSPSKKKGDCPPADEV